MANIVARGGIKSVSIEAVVIRRNGRIEDEGRIVFDHKDKWRVWLWRAGRVLHRTKRALQRLGRKLKGSN